MQGLNWRVRETAHFVFNYLPDSYAADHLPWITGRAEDAMVVAEECLARALAVDHAQSLCWAITFNLCPVAIWSGDTENANRFTAIAMAHSEKTFETLA